MNRLFFILTLLFSALHATAQESIMVVPTTCDNGQSTDYLATADSLVQITLDIELDQPRTLRCVLDGNWHHDEVVATSGPRTVSFDHLGPGNPFHTTAFTLYDELNNPTTSTVSVQNIRPWVYLPPLTYGEVVVTNDSIIHWTVEQGPWNHLPNEASGVGGCPEHHMIMIGGLVTSGGESIPANTVEMTESWGTTLYEFEASYSGPLDAICTDMQLMRVDAGATEPPDFEPIEVSTGNLEEECILAGILSTNTSELSPSGSLLLQGRTLTFQGEGAYVVISLSGALVESGTVQGTRTIDMGRWNEGMYIVDFTTQSEKFTKKFVCE